MGEFPELHASTETAVPAPKRKPARRPSKPDAVLAAAVDTARSGVLQIAQDSEVGAHLGAFPEAERLVTHRFSANVPGYAGWEWFATLARVPRGKDATVCEVGLLPSERSLLAPAWVPWSERVRPEDADPQAEHSVPDGPAPDPALEDDAPAAPDEQSADAPITEPIVPDTVSADTQAVESESSTGGEATVD